jgi:solute carrier family 25 phosphate transporter 23/24/25/41
MDPQQSHSNSEENSSSYSSSKSNYPAVSLGEVLRRFGLARPTQPRFPETTTSNLSGSAQTYGNLSRDEIYSSGIPPRSDHQGVAEQDDYRILLEEEEQEQEEEEEEEEEEQVGFMYPSRTVKLLLAGGLAGVVSRTATAPLDRLKMLLQVNDAEKRMTMREGLRYMAREGSIKSFFKGNGTNVIKIAPETAIKLTMNDIYKRIIASDPDEITPPQRMAAGALAGATAQAIIYPLELVKTRLAVCHAGTYSGIVDCATKVLAQEGWRSFYRGLVPSMMGILPYAGVDITVFELLKEHLLDQYDGMPPPHSILCAGMLSSSLAQFSAYPLALVRTRLQAQGIGGKPLKYNGMVDVLWKTYKKEGFRGLYKGSMTNLAKLAPAAGISWFVFEETKVLLGLSMRS